jgi:hypothetical protein
MGFPIRRYQNKYNAIKTKINYQGKDFYCASRGESDLFQYLIQCEKNGEISDLKTQVNITLKTVDGFKKRCIPDFSYTDTKTNETVYCEFKGRDLDSWKLIKKVWAVCGPGKLIVYKQKSNRTLYLTETIIPKVCEKKENPLTCPHCGKEIQKA